MTDAVGEAYMLSIHELALLAAGSGARRLIGCFGKPSSLDSRSNALKCLSGLVSRGLLLAEDGVFRMEDGLSACVSRISGAIRCIEFEPADALLPLLCIYVSHDGLALVEPGILAEDIRLSVIAEDGIIEALTVRDMLPRATAIETEYLTGAAGAAEPDLKITLFDENGEPLGFAAVNASGALPLITCDPSDGEAEVYSSEVLLHILTKYLKGELP